MTGKFGEVTARSTRRLSFIWRLDKKVAIECRSAITQAAMAGAPTTSSRPRLTTPSARGQRRHPADRPPEQAKDQPSLDHLGQPGREVPGRAGQQRLGTPPERAQCPIDCGAAGPQPGREAVVEVQRYRREQSSHADPGHRDQQHGEPGPDADDQRQPPEVGARRRGGGGAKNQRGRAQEREQHLGERSNGDVVDHRRGRLPCGNAARGEQAGAREVAADLRGRQQGVYRLADPAQPQRGRPAQPPFPEQYAPGRRVQLHRDDPVQGGSHQRPSATGAQDRENLGRARSHGDEEQQHYPEQAAQGDDLVLPRDQIPRHQYGYPSMT
jgi:hypothetical protein